MQMIAAVSQGDIQEPSFEQQEGLKGTLERDF
jgi:hypothetical protein